MTKKKNASRQSTKKYLDQAALEAKLMAWANDTRPLPALGSQVVGEEIFEISKDEIYFPAALSPAQRRIVHQSAENTGLFHATIDEKEGKRVCVSQALKENSGEIATNPIPKPVTPHAALLISDEQAVGLKALVSAPHNPAVARYMQYIQRVCAVGADVKDLSGCDVDLSRHPCVFVDTVEGLYAVAAHINTCAEFAFDLEMHSERSYHGITCLIQLAVNQTNTFPYQSTDYVIDCLAVWDHIGPALGGIFANPDIIKFGHALRMDTAALYRDFAIVMRSVFDTQVAWSVLFDTSQSGMVGLSPLLSHYGAPENSGQDMAGIKHSLSTYDWRTRPLPLNTIHYAQMDVHLLIPAAYILINDLVRKEAAENAETGEEMASSEPENFGYVDSVFYQSQVNAALLWHPRKRPKRSSAWASYELSAGVQDDGEGEGVDAPPDSVPQPASPKDLDPGVEGSQPAIHVHMSGSFKRLSKELKVKRRATRNERGLNGSVKWRTDMHLLVTQRLVEWREQIALELDESPTYICSTALMVKIAEKLPTDFESLSQVWAPLPPVVLQMEKESKEAGPRYDEIPRCVSQTIRAAIDEYHVIIENFWTQHRPVSAVQNDGGPILVVNHRSDEPTVNTNAKTIGVGGYPYVLFATCTCFFISITVDWFSIHKK